MQQIVKSGLSVFLCLFVDPVDAGLKRRPLLLLLADQMLQLRLDSLIPLSKELAELGGFQLLDLLLDIFGLCEPAKCQHKVYLLFGFGSCLLDPLQV